MSNPAGTSPKPDGAGIRSTILRHLRRVLVLVVGGTLLVVGVILIFVPGPAVVVIPAALAILATEFLWASRLLARAKSLLRSAKDADAGTGAPPSGQ